MPQIKIKKLDLVENTCTEAHLVLAEELLDESKYALDTDQEQISISLKLKKAEAEVWKSDFDTAEYHCSCTTFQKESSCEHAVAALIKFRSFLTTLKSTTPRKKRKASGRNKGIDVSTIVNNIPSEDLLAFLKTYASKDRRFSIALKTRFAHKVELRDNTLKYKQILDSILSPVSQREKKTKLTDLRQLCKVIIELSGQAQDMISIHQHIEAFDILQVITNKWEYVKKNQVPDVEVYSDLQKSIHTSWYQLSNKTLAPDLIKRINVFFRELISKTYFYPWSTQYNCGEISFLFASTQKDKSELASLLKERLQKAIDIQLKAKLYCLVFRADEKTLKGHIKELIENPKIIPNVIEHLNMLRSYNTAKDLIEGLLDHNITASLKIQELQLDTLLGLKEWDTAIEKCALLSKSTHRLSYYKKSRSIIEESYHKQLYHKTVSLLDDAHGKDDYFRISIYHIEDKWEEILNYIEANQDFLIAERYAAYLNKKDEDRLSACYIKLLDDYFQNHIGEKANEFLLEILDSLRRQRCTEVADDIVDFVKTKFPMRLEFA